MLCRVQALAKESGASFINIRASSVQSKWFGETQKHVAAIFSLAYKMQPTIIFIGAPSAAARTVGPPMVPCHPQIVPSTAWRIRPVVCVASSCPP